ncbi:MAG TPA: nucleoside recognition protein [Bacteroidales bacterium]|nr:nucleoside recognition protein [Bacteroidales bacterium]
MTSNKSFSSRVLKSIKEAFPKGLKTAYWLLKITIPVSFAVVILDYFGGIDFIAGYTTPVFKFIGLPGVAAVVLITSVFTNIYSVIAVLTTLALPNRDGTIIAVMCLISHGFIIETAVLRKTGSSPARMLILRLSASFVAGWFLNLVMPGSSSIAIDDIVREQLVFSEVFYNWLHVITKTVIKILVLVNLLLILQKLLDEFGLIDLLVKPLKPLIKLFGLPLNTSFSWVVANILGLAYGSAVIIEQLESGKISKADADILNHHIALSHSQLEDPLLFLTLGFSLGWLIFPRMIIAIVAVWLRKAELWFKQNYYFANGLIPRKI